MKPRKILLLAVPVVWAFVEPLVPEFVPPEFVVRLRALVEPLVPEFVVPEFVVPEFVVPEFVVPEFVVPEFVAVVELSAIAEPANFAEADLLRILFVFVLVLVWALEEWFLFLTLLSLRTRRGLLSCTSRPYGDSATPKLSSVNVYEDPLDWNARNN